MLFLLFLLSLLLNLSVQAETPIQLQCVTSVPTTSFLIETVKDKVRLRMIHHNGLQYAPAITGVFTPNDLPGIAEKAALVQKLGEDMTFQWDLDKCRKLSDTTFRCTNSKDVQEVNGVKISPWAFFTSEVVETTSFGVFKAIHVRIDLDIGGKSSYLEMPYYGSDCSTSLTALQTKPSKKGISAR